MVSGVDGLEPEAGMYGGRTGQGDSSSEDMEEQLDNEEPRGQPAVANGNRSNSSNGNVEGQTPEEATDCMEVDTAHRGTSILSNPARFEALIRWREARESGVRTHPSSGRSLQQFSVQLEQEKGRNEANTTMLQVIYPGISHVVGVW
jgi:hypothetical protein